MVNERAPQVVDARGGLVRAVHDHARQHDRERRAADDPGRPRPDRRRSSSGSSAGYALTFGALMLTGGKLADLFGRRRIFVVGLVDLHGVVARLRARGHRGHADRRARRPGRRRRPDEPRDPLDHRRHLPAAPARHGDRHLGRRLRARPRDRPARRRADHRAGQLELDLLHQRAGRRARDRRRVLFIDESRDTSREQRPDVPGLVTSAIGLFALTLRADRGEQLRLDVDADPGRRSASRPSRSSPSSSSSSTSGCRCSTSASSATAASPARTR